MRACIIEVKRRYAETHLPCDAVLRQNMHMRKGRHFIKQWRKSKGWTQIQLAERAGVTQAMVSRVESGKPYDEEFIERVAEAMNLTVADLLVRDPSDPAGIWSIWDTLQPTEQAQAVEVIKALKRTGTGG